MTIQCFSPLLIMFKTSTTTIIYCWLCYLKNFFFYFFGGMNMKCIRLIKERVFCLTCISTFVKEAPKGPNYMKIIKTNMKKEEVNCTF